MESLFEILKNEPFIKFRDRYFTDLSVWSQLCNGDFEKLKSHVKKSMDIEILRIKGKVHYWVKSLEPNDAESTISHLISQAEHDKINDKAILLLKLRDYFSVQLLNTNKEKVFFNENLLDAFDQTFDLYCSANQEILEFMAEIHLKCQKGEFITDERVKKDYFRSILKRKPTFVLDPDFPISQLIHKADGNMLVQLGYEEIAILFLYLRKHNLILDLDSNALSEFLSLLTGLSTKQLVTEIRAVNVYFDEDKPKKQNSVGDYKENFKNVISALKTIIEEMESKI